MAENMVIKSKLKHRIGTLVIRTVPGAELIVKLTKSESRKEVNLCAQPSAALDGAKTHRK